MKAGYFYANATQMKKYLIAIVDDDPDDQEIFNAAFTENYDSIEIASFSGGTEFLDYLNASEKLPNIVVTDMRMPLLSGNDVIEQMKNNPRTSHIPVVILTGQGSDLERDKAMALGAVYFFLKPVNIIDYSILTDRIVEKMNQNLS